MDNPLLTEEIYITYKPLLFSLAYRMLGSVGLAEDIVHEAFISLNKISQDQIRDIKPYLCKITTNLCINHLKSASKQREVYVGTWLPEPMILEEMSDPYHHSLRKETISIAYIFLLQQLSWVERAVYLLKEVFQLDYNEIADIVGKSSVNCRQIFRRAKICLNNHSARAKNSQIDVEESVELSMFSSGNNSSRTVIEKFMKALETGNIQELLNVLSSDAVFYSDGGGKVTAALKPIYGADRIVKLLAKFSKTVPNNYSYIIENINGFPGILFSSEGKTISVISFDFNNEGTISTIYTVVNPDKLRHIRLD